MKHQPLITAGLVTSLATAVIGVLVAFGVPMTKDQQTAVLVLVGVVAPLIVAAAAWRKVTPSAEVVVKQETPGAEHVAGPASPLPDGTPVDVTASGPASGPPVT